MSFATVPMYNIGKKFHEKGKNWVGYVVRIDSADYYFAGDTDAIPEMENIKADVAFACRRHLYDECKRSSQGGQYHKAGSRSADALRRCGRHGSGREVFIRGLDRSIKGVLLK